MTSSNLFLFQVDLRPPVAADRPTVAQSAREDANRFLEALQQAETRNPVAKSSSREASAAGSQREQAQQARNHARDQDLRATGTARDVQESQTTRSSQENQAGQKNQECHAAEESLPRESLETAESQESSAAQSGQEVQAGQEFQEARPAKEANSGVQKGRSRKKSDDGQEGVFPGMPGIVLPPSCGAPNLCMGMELRPVGFAPGPTPQTGGMAGQTWVGQAPEAGQGPIPGQVGMTPPPLPQRAAEVMAVRAMVKTETMVNVQGHASEEKQDFAFALRLMGDAVANGSGTRSATATQTTLSAHSPTFGEDLAEQAGRLRVISRPGVSEQVRITLHPQDLGAMDMRLVVDEQNQVHLMITTDSDATKELLHRQMPQLREALARQNLGMGEVMVHVEDGRGGNQAPEWGFQGGRESARQEFAQRRGVERSESSVRGVETLPRPLPAYTGGGGLSLIV